MLTIMKMNIFLKNFSEYDLASALVPDDVGHAFKRPHQVPWGG